jgi:hypothetical protein
VIHLIPYSKVDGVWSLPDEALEDAFYKTGDLIKSIFWTGKISTPKDFINYFKTPSNLPVFVFKDAKPCGYAWINNIGMGHAHSHFNVFQEFWGSEDKKEIFESVINYWFGFKDDKGALFDTLIGMIPKFNTHAMRYVEQNGFNRVGEIPNMVHDSYSNVKFPIVIFYRSR